MTEAMKMNHFHSVLLKMRYKLFIILLRQTGKLWRTYWRYFAEHITKPRNRQPLNTNGTNWCLTQTPWNCQTSLKNSIKVLKKRERPGNEETRSFKIWVQKTQERAGGKRTDGQTTTKEYPKCPTCGKTKHPVERCCKSAGAHLKPKNLKLNELTTDVYKPKWK